MPGQPPSAAPEGEILPPGGAILPPQTELRKSFRPSRKPEKPSKPSTEGGLPGLPARAWPRAASGSARGRATEAGDQTQGHNPSPKGGRLSEATEKSPAEIEPEGTNQVTMAVGSSDERQVQPGTVVLLVDPQDPERGHVASAAHRADSIAIAAPTSPAHEIEAAAYATVESAAPTAAGNAKSAPPTCRAERILPRGTGAQRPMDAGRSALDGGP